MVEFLAEYGLFLAKTITIVIAIIIIMATAVANTMKQRREDNGSIIITHLNKEINDLKDEIVNAREDEHTLKKVHKEEKKRVKNEKKTKKKSIGKGGDTKKRIFVLNFDGDPKASQVDELRKAITAVLTMAKPEKDEVMLRLESPGGMVHAYGLAASQLQRIRSREIPLTICVDKVAASGGYMMACVANKLIAAPFAYIGSIGVLVQMPNFNRLLKEKHVDYEMVTAGEYKRTLTMFGENTKKDREKMEEDIQEVHTLFKDFVRTSRPDMAIDKLATGETWLGSRARELGLVDETGTSDEYIVAACDNAEVYEVAYEKKKKITDKLGSVLEGALDNILMRWLQRSGNKDELIS